MYYLLILSRKCKIVRKKVFNMNKLPISEDLASQISLPQGISVRQFIEADFPLIQKLYKQEGWLTFINRPEDALAAWKSSNITLVAVDGDTVVGLVRALTDEKITTYIAEIIVDTNYRGKGIGKALLDICHSLCPYTRFDLLSTEGADQFYKSNNFRIATGFRKSFKF